MLKSVWKKIQDHQNNVQKIIDDNERQKLQDKLGLNTEKEEIKKESHQENHVESVPAEVTSTVDFAKMMKVFIWLAFLVYMAWLQWGEDLFGAPKCDSSETVNMVTKMNTQMYDGKFNVLGLTYISEIGYQKEKDIRFCQAQVEMRSIPDNFPFPTAVKYTIEKQPSGQYRVQLLPF